LSWPGDHGSEQAQPPRPSTEKAVGSPTTSIDRVQRSSSSALAILSERSMIRLSRGTASVQTTPAEHAAGAGTGEWSKLAAGG